MTFRNYFNVVDAFFWGGWGGGAARHFSRGLPALLHIILVAYFVGQDYVIPKVPSTLFVTANGQELCFTGGPSQRHFGTWGLMML